MGSCFGLQFWKLTCGPIKVQYLLLSVNLNFIFSTINEGSIDSIRIYLFLLHLTWTTNSYTTNI